MIEPPMPGSPSATVIAWVGAERAKDFEVIAPRLLLPADRLRRNEQSLRAAAIRPKTPERDRLRFRRPLGLRLDDRRDMEGRRVALREVSDDLLLDGRDVTAAVRPSVSAYVGKYDAFERTRSVNAGVKSTKVGYLSASSRTT